MNEDSARWLGLALWLRDLGLSVPSAVRVANLITDRGLIDGIVLANPAQR